MVGLSGNSSLIAKEQQFLTALGLDCLPLQNDADWQLIDSLVISGLSIRDWPNPEKIAANLKNPCWHRRPVLADGWGCVFLDKNISGILNCRILERPSFARHTELIHIPSWEKERTLAFFAPDIYFTSIAPNIAVLAHNKSRGPVIIRQGNVLAMSFLSVLSRNPEIYHYYRRMF